MPETAPRIVTIDSQYSAMGRWISVIAGESAGFELLEGRELCAVAEEDWLTPAYLARFDDRLTADTPADLALDPEFQRVSGALSRAIRAAAETGPCIIHERAAAHVLADHTDVLSVLVHCTDLPARLTRARFDPHFPELVDVDDDTVLERIRREDRARASYHDAISPAPWGVASSYDLCLNSGTMTREKCAEILVAAMSPRQLDVERSTALVEDFTEGWVS